MGNPLQDLNGLGQSVWLDSIKRSYLGQGNYLDRLISANEVSGLTSNPSIFNTALDSDSDEYAEQLGSLSGSDPRQALWALMQSDVQAACDQFLPLYESSAGQHGLVSIECDPARAFHPDATVEEAHRLWREIDRPNLMVKIPGTGPGIEAIRRATADGINVNVTLLFSVARYEAVA